MNAPTSLAPAPAATAPAAPTFNYAYFEARVGQRLRLTLSKPVKLKGMSQASDKLTARVFKSNQSDELGILVGAQKSRGSYLYQWLQYLATGWDARILSANEKARTEKPRLSPLQCWEKVYGKRHPNAWASEAARDKARLDAGETDLYDDYYQGRPKFRQIAAIFRPWERAHELAQLQAAFDQCLPYSYRQNTSGNNGRDFSISVEPRQDGQPGVRAYFSSEYPGCGNGDYYLLLSPTTAVFYETD